FSRTEQVLKMMMSASSGVSVSSAPLASLRISAIFSESYSFIWQPKVRMKSFLWVSGMAARRGGFISRGRWMMGNRAILADEGSPCLPGCRESMGLGCPNDVIGNGLALLVAQA